MIEKTAERSGKTVGPHRIDRASLIASERLGLGFKDPDQLDEQRPAAMKMACGLLTGARGG